MTYTIKLFESLDKYRKGYIANQGLTKEVKEKKMKYQRQQIKQTKKNLKEAKKEYSSLKKIVNKKFCPTCERGFSDQEMAMIESNYEHFKRSVISYSKYLDGLQKDLDSISKKPEISKPLYEYIKKNRAKIMEEVE